MRQPLHQVLNVYKTPSKFFIQPWDEPSTALVIDLAASTSHNTITSSNSFSISQLPANAKSWLVYGVIGIKQLHEEKYLVVIAKASKIGQIQGQDVYEMDQAELIPFYQQDGEPPNPDWNEIYYQMLESVLKMPSFYFSYSHDLTNSLQRIDRLGARHFESTETDQHFYDCRFQWNDHLMSDFKCAKRFQLPFIVGFISIKEIQGPQTMQNLILLSRRSIYRAGTRFNRRGADLHGRVANFVETELIVEHFKTTIGGAPRPSWLISPSPNRNTLPDYTTSFVQIRGSIPLIWCQKPTGLQYKPPIEISHEADQQVTIQRHFSELFANYGDVSVVNLIDQRGHEAELEREFCYHLEQLKNKRQENALNYHYFDFHKECGKMRWSRLSLLMDRIQKEIEGFDYFAARANQVISRQRGVIRTNCIDSLDRTNVVQSMIAFRVLQTQKIGRFSSWPDFLTVQTRLEDDKSLKSMFDNVWADNADALSIQYAGTPALKTDFTRTGQRTTLGAINDGVNSMTRFVYNNFYDDFRQDAIDLFLGNYDGYPSPLYRPTVLKSYANGSTLPVVILTLVILFFYYRFQWQ